MKHPLATLFDGHDEVQAEIDSRPADTTDHAAETRRTVDTYLKAGFSRRR